MKNILKLIFIFCLCSNFAFPMDPSEEVKLKLTQLKGGLVELKAKLGQLSEKVWKLRVSLDNEQLKDLKDDDWHIINFYCDKHKINPGGGKKTSLSWSQLMEELKDGGKYKNLDLFDGHSYIRWIFPTFYKGWSGDEHLATRQTQETFKNNSILIKRVIESFKTFVGGYYKLKIDIVMKDPNNRSLDDVKVSIDEKQFQTTKANIGMSGWHNLKRIKRVLHSLMAFGLENYAMAFFACLQIINKDPDIKDKNQYFEEWHDQVYNFHDTYEMFDVDGNYTGPDQG